MQANLGLDRLQILEYVRTIIPIVVQLKRDAQGGRVVSEIFYRPVPSKTASSIGVERILRRRDHPGYRIDLEADRMRDIP